MPLAGLPIGKRSALLLDKENMTKYSISPMSSLYELYLRHPRISTDSRRIEPDSVFFALRGASFDGNRFAADALEKGAAYAVVDDPSLPNTRPDKADRLIVVDDALQTLQALAREHRRELGLPILAITGSNGKTTTKELVSRVLAEKYEVYATRGNLNNHIGVPLTLLAMTRDVEFGIVEMGASACGEIALLCSIAEPNYGIVTNIGRAHLEGFGGPEGVRRGKGELYDWQLILGFVAWVIPQQAQRWTCSEAAAAALGVPDDEAWRFDPANLRHAVVELIHRAEEERARDVRHAGGLEDGGLALHRAQLVRVDIGEIHMDMTRLRHVQNGGVYHAEQDRDRQVKDDRCEHRDQKLADTGLELVAEDVADALPVVHAPRRYHQNAGKCRKRQARHHAAEQKHGGEQENGVEHARKARLLAGFHRYARARNGRRSRHTAEKR